MSLVATPPTDKFGPLTVPDRGVGATRDSVEMWRG